MKYAMRPGSISFYACIIMIVVIIPFVLHYSHVVYNFLTYTPLLAVVHT